MVLLAQKGGRMTPLYCTIRQAIELTGTNKKRLNEWIKDGLPIYRPPGKTALVRVSDLDEYIRQHRVDVQVTSDMVDSLLRRA